MTLFFPDIVAPHDQVGMAYWVAGHYYEHRAMLAFGLRNNFDVADYDLYSWVPDDPVAQRAWIEAHGLVHDSLRAFTGVTGPDYADVNFSDDRQFAEWLGYHAQEHAVLRQLMGLP